MNLIVLILFIIVIMALFGAPHLGVQQFGNAPYGLGLVLVIILVVLLFYRGF